MYNPCCNACLELLDFRIQRYLLYSNAAIAIKAKMAWASHAGGPPNKWHDFVVGILTGNIIARIFAHLLLKRIKDLIKAELVDPIRLSFRTDTGLIESLWPEVSAALMLA